MPQSFGRAKLVARAMISVALRGHTTPILYNKDINVVGAGLPSNR